MNVLLTFLQLIMEVFRELYQKHKQEENKLLLMLLMLTMLTSSCLSSRKMVQVVPPYPTLQSATVNEQGGICLDKKDTATLLHYIEELRNNFNN